MEQGFPQAFDSFAPSTEERVVPATVLARWAAMAGHLSSASMIPTQPTAA